MADSTGMLLIVAVCAFVLLLIAAAAKKMQLLTIVLRGVFGTLAIFLLNLVLKSYGIENVPGLNGWSILTSVTLGFPGIAALYGICFYKSL